MTTDITQTDYPLNPDTGKPVTLSEVSKMPWLPTNIDVHLWLGYPQPISRDQVGINSTFVPYNHPYASQIHRHVAWLQVIDEQLFQAAEDSVAGTVDKLTVSFNRMIANLNMQGSKTLQSLSLILDIPVKFDKYMVQYRGSNCIKAPV
jgi:hypothetical protein